MLNRISLFSFMYVGMCVCFFLEKKIKIFSCLFVAVVNVYKEELDKMKEETVSKNNIKLMKKNSFKSKEQSISSAFRSMSIAKDFLMIWHTFSSS